MDKRISLFLRQFQSVSAGLVINVALKDHFRPVAFGPFYFDKRCGRRHDDHSLHAEFVGRICHALGVIARRGGNQTLFFFLFA